MLSAMSLRVSEEDPIPIPPLTVAGRGRRGPGLVLLDVTGIQSKEPSALLEWPEFNNGFAAGLRCIPSSLPRTSTRSFLRLHRPGTPTFAHGGLLLAFGCLGLLRHLPLAELYSLLSPAHYGTSAGLLLGLAASYAGRADGRISRALCAHLPHALPGSAASEVSVLPALQSVSLLGLGLLYRASGSRLISDFLLTEIDRAPAERERSGHCWAYSLCAGLALGMVQLGRGSQEGASSWPARFESRLLELAHGGWNSDPTDVRPAPGAPEVTLPRDFVNVTLTAPGAVLAYGLVHLQSESAAAAAQVRPPRSVAEMDAVRADVLMCRVVSGALIRWSAVQPTASWVLGNVPPIARAAMAAKRRKLKHSDNLLAAILSDLGGGGGGGVEAAGPAGEHPLDAPPPGGVGLIDFELCREQYAAALTGAAIALGLRFAGTWDPRCKRLLLQLLGLWQHLGAPDEEGLRRRARGGGRCGLWPAASAAGAPLSALWLGSSLGRTHLQALAPGPLALESGRSATCAALGCVMAGSGDVEVLRAIRAVRSATSPNQDVGHHMGVGAGLGLCMLGGGRVGLRNDPSSVAALLIALIPYTHHGSADNRSQPQASRHLWSLAMHRCCVDVEADASDGDVGIGSAAGVALAGARVRLAYRGGQRPLHLLAPTVIPAVEDVTELVVEAPGFASRSFSGEELRAAWPLADPLQSAGLRIRLSRA